MSLTDPSVNKPPCEAVCIYVDNSNIFHEGQRFAELRGEDRYRFRIYFGGFLELATRSRLIREVVWGGSIPTPNDSVWQRLRALNVDPFLIPRSETGENDTVDHRIQLCMFRHARKYRGCPGTIVLCTGDGKGYLREEGFLYDLEGHAQDGWRIEVLSWTHCCHPKLREFAKRRGRFIPLDHYYDAITFIEGGRRAVGC